MSLFCYSLTYKTLDFTCSWSLKILYLGIPIRTTLDNSTTVQYAGLIHQLTAKARSTVRDIDPQVWYSILKIAYHF